MSSIDDALAEINQELEDMAAAEAAAQEKGLSLGDYDLQSLTKLRAKDRMREEALAAQQEQAMPETGLTEEKIKQDVQAFPKVMGEPTAQLGGGGSTLPKGTVTLNEEVIPLSSTTAPSTTQTSVPKTSPYTNVDPESYKMTLAQGGMVDVPSSSAEVKKEWLKEVMKEGKLPTFQQTLNLSTKGEDETRRVREVININDDPSYAEAVKESPQAQGMNLKYENMFKTTPPEYLVVEDKNETYNGKPVTYLQPKVTDEWIKNNLVYDPKKYAKFLYPRLQWERDVRDMFPDMKTPEIEKKFNIKLTRI